MPNYNVEEVMRHRGEKSQRFKIGDTVQILTGPYNDFRGKIEGINKGLFLLKIKEIIFGRDEPLKLDFSIVENLSEN